MHLLPRPRHHASGFALLESILALGLFVSVATAMAVALDQLATASMAARQESMMMRRLESELTEAVSTPRLSPGTSQSGPDDFGISIVREIERVSMQNQQSESLEGLFRIRVTASMPDGRKRERFTRELETLTIRLEMIQATDPAGGGILPEGPAFGSEGNLK